MDLGSRETQANLIPQTLHTSGESSSNMNPWKGLGLFQKKRTEVSEKELGFREFIGYKRSRDQGNAVGRRER